MHISSGDIDFVLIVYFPQTMMKGLELLCHMLNQTAVAAAVASCHYSTRFTKVTSFSAFWVWA